eukprot:7389797-Prymnesium_polylepis.1
MHAVTVTRFLALGLAVAWLQIACFNQNANAIACCRIVKPSRGTHRGSGHHAPPPASIHTVHGSAHNVFSP